MNSGEIKYPFIYIPGMFDNGDLMNLDYLLVNNLNNKDGFYYKNYFNEIYNYEKDIINCSSNIVDSKYKRLSVANLIGPFRTNISLDLMSNRLFCLIQGKAPKGKNYKKITNYKGNDYEGNVIFDGKIIKYNGLIEEIWAKYGNKVYYKKDGNKCRITLNSNENNSSDFYMNKDSYFNAPDEIKFNIICHSSGGLALRKYIQLCRKESLNHHINVIINLSVPQKGARMNFSLKKAFPLLLDKTLTKFYNNKDIGNVIIKETGKEYSYLDLIEKTRVNMMVGDSLKARRMRKLIGNYILYCIPFDGEKGVLGRDPALYDLHPAHRFVNSLNNENIPKEIKIYNFSVKSPFAKMFENVGECLELGKNDGVVDYEDTTLEMIKNYDDLTITNIDVEKANHIPLPQIKPLFELRETVIKFYYFLQITLKGKYEKEEGVDIIHALLLGIMKEFGLELNYFLEHEDYSVIDYFAENPINFDDY